MAGRVREGPAPLCDGGALPASALLDDLAADVPVGIIARCFHDAFVQAIVTAAELVRSLYGITTLALSGGVFMNRYLLEHALAALEQTRPFGIEDYELAACEG